MTRNQNVNLDKTQTFLLVNYFKYIPKTSVDVERTSSLHKYILSNRRCNFQEYHLEVYINYKF
jgi:hypothetical protein